MIEYVIPNNPDDRVLKKASDLLRQGEMVILPTDTSWVAVCDPFVKGSIDKLYKFKGEEKSKHFSILCDNISRASEIANISDQAFRLMRNKIPGHYTFIFQATKKMIKAVKASKTDHEVGIRFSPCELTKKVIEAHGHALISTNLTNEMLGIGEEDEIYGYMVEEALSSKVAMILDPGEYEIVGASTIIDFSKEGEIDLIREGAGDPSPFGL